MIVGLTVGRCRPACYHGLVATASRRPWPSRVAHLPPVSTLFAAFLGYNPVQHLLGPHVLAQLPPGPAGRAHRAAPSSPA